MKNTQLFFQMMVVLLITAACGSEKTGSTIPAEDRLKLASAYATNGMYEASVNEYLDYLDQYDVEPARRANTYFTIANIYFERLHDYEKALQYYFKIKYLYPQSQLQGETGKKIVNCLERLERSGDARRVLEKEAALNPETVAEHRPGAVLAESGSHKITQGDLEFEISKLPAYMQEEFDSKEKKKEILQQIILRELLYESAKREGLDQDKDVLEGVFRAKQALMTEKLLQRELQDEVQITPEDAELYYMAHKDQYVEKNEQGKVVRQKSFNEVKEQAARDLTADRQQKAYQRLVERLMKAEKVKIYDQRIQ